MKSLSIKKSRAIAVFFLALATQNPQVLASYRSESNTGTEIFDEIENARRSERDTRLTAEQRNFMKDLAEARARLQNPTDSSDIVPIAFEGDDLMYDELTGDFVATGKVDVIQLDGRRFQTDRMSGNLRDQIIVIPDKAHILQLMEGAPRITLDGFRGKYSIKDKTGTLENASGKVGEYYLTGKRFEFFPDRIIIHDGTQTKCGAKIPDYSLRAKRIEIINQETIRMYSVQFLIKNNVVGGRKFYERRVGQSDNHDFPRLGYNEDHGFYIRQSFSQPIVNHLDANVDFRVETKNGVRSNGDITYQNRNLRLSAIYGFFGDDDYVWMQKEPGFIATYGDKFGSLPLTWDLKYEAGHWHQNAIKSFHQYAVFGISRDPIVFNNWQLRLHTSYGVTKESEDDSTVHGPSFDAVLGKMFNDKFASYVGYHYSKLTTDNALFNFDLDSYSNKFDFGLSYQITDIDRLVFGVEYNLDDGELAATDYFWYRDLHCSQLILRYRDKKHSKGRLEAHWNFLPW